MELFFYIGRISVHDLEQALKVIKHAPPPEVVQGVVKKLDVDSDGYVMLEHVLDLIGEEGLGESTPDFCCFSSLTLEYIRCRRRCGCTGSTGTGERTSRFKGSEATEGRHYPGVIMPHRTMDRLSITMGCFHEWDLSDFAGEWIA